ncbi:WxL domain-containing protein [Listeria kieliensis]
MKKMKLIKMNGLLALTLGILLSPSFMSNVSASTTLESDIDVQMSPGKDRADKEYIFPFDPNKKLLDQNVPGLINSDKSSLLIDITPVFDFYGASISGKDENYYSNMPRVYYFLPLPGGTTVPDQDGFADISSYIQISDLRGSNSGWELTVSGSKLLAGNGSGDSIDGAELQFSGITAKSVTDSKYKPSILNESITVNSQDSLIVAAKSREGMGTWAISLGNEYLETDKYSPRRKTKNVKLHVPGEAKKVPDQTYLMELTWTLSNTPTSS